MPTRRSFLGAASSLALPALFPSARTAGAQQTGDTSMTPDLILHTG
ncbi:hypothetical protein IB270_34250, partial [Ensifer sp. ENS05]|nr:hypothetical protein [Ensifer sp. ENS05]